MSYPEQVGGTHYKADVQHWDVMEGADIAYLEATASKYIVRWRKKGGPQDLEKAATYLERALVEERPARRLVPVDQLKALVDENRLDPWDAALLELIHLDGSQVALRSAAAILREKAASEQEITGLQERLREPRAAVAEDRR
jgi:hypothetical protein